MPAVRTDLRRTQQRGPIWLVALLALLACSPVAVAADLINKIDQLILDSPVSLRASIGVHVVDLVSGETLYGSNQERLFLPASNMKLFTSALALTTLGADYRFETRLMREASGDVVLVGSGDPSLSGRRYPYDKDARNGNPLEAIEQLADQAVAAGLQQVRGNIVGDDRLYPWSPYPPSWTGDDALYDYGAPVSALTLNDNVVSVTVRPGTAPGSLARVALTPRMEYFAIDNRVTTIAGSGGRVEVERVPGERQLLLRGTIGVRSGAVVATRAVEDPALFAATAMYQALVDRGVAVRGRPVARHRYPGTPASDPTSAELLASRRSPPLSELLLLAEKISHNLHAELLLREVGRVAGGDGTLDKGLSAMQAMLKRAGVPDGEWISEDASGLARNDEVTPHALTHLLTYMDASPDRQVWRSFLPVGGQDGTLSRRLCCVLGVDEGEARVQAKTGSLSRAVALSGYAETDKGERRAFAILVNNFSTPSAQVRELVDKIALALTE